MNPIGQGGIGPGNHSRPSIFTDEYPPAVRQALNWNDVPGTSQPNVTFGAPQSTGFNMQPQGFLAQPNFQFSTDREPFSSTVHFPFPRIHHRTSIERPLSSLRCKRKTESPSLQAAKQFITEEIMSNHLSKLRISSETPTEMESEEGKERRLYMCEEMKRFQVQNEPIIPESLLSRMNRPCTALVLWKPPESILVPHVFNCREEDSENNNNNDNNSNSVEQEQPDLLNEMECEEL